MTQQTTTKEQAEMLARIMVLEKQLLDSQRSNDRLNTEVTDLYNRLEKLKDEIRHIRDVSVIEPQLETLEKEISSIKMELPELLLIKKMFMSLLASILTAFLALIWNNVVIKGPSTDKGELDEIAKKVVDEYNKGGKK
jgi:predicted nuclease with TOPRIM domain